MFNLATLVQQPIIVTIGSAKVPVYPIPVDGLVLIAANHKKAFAALFDLAASKGRGDIDLEKLLSEFPDLLYAVIGLAVVNRADCRDINAYVTAAGEQTAAARLLPPGNQIDLLVAAWDAMALDLGKLTGLLKGVVERSEGMISPPGKATSPPAAKP
jgi:hypothetical protein